jgi:hypothetical protein
VAGGFCLVLAVEEAAILSLLILVWFLEKSKPSIPQSTRSGIDHPARHQSNHP